MLLSSAVGQLEEDVCKPEVVHRADWFDEKIA